MNKFIAAVSIVSLLHLSSSAQVVPGDGIDNFPAAEYTADGENPSGEFPPADVLTNISSIASGDWNSPYTWDCACLPSADDGVRILNGHSVTLGSETTLINLAIEEGGELNMLAAAPVSIRLYGDTDIQGTLNGDAGKMQFVGLLDHFFWGNAQVGDLEVINASLELYGDMTLSKSLSLQNTTLITNGLLTLGYSNGSMATIDEVQNSDIEGEMTFVQNFNWPEEGWIAVASPAADATFEDWNNELTTTGFMGSDFPEMEPSILYYDETTPSEETALMAPYDITDGIEPGRGYYLYGTPGAVEVKTTANPVIGMHVFNMTFTDNGDADLDGVNVMGNPYAAKVNWDDNDWIRYGVDQALYVYDPQTKQFQTYVDGLSINGGHPIIEPGQAFVVRATESNCGLIAQEGVKTTVNGTGVNQVEGILSLQMLNIFGGSDQMMVRMNDAATTDFDLGKDAVKMMSESGHNIYTKGSAQKIGINQLAKSAGMELPIYVNAPIGGNFMLTIPQAPEDTDGGCMVVKDELTGEFIPVETGATYAFTSDAVADSHRFTLMVAAPLEVEMEHVSCHGEGDAYITVQGQGEGELTYQWFDDSNEPMLTYQIVGGTSTVSGLSAGTYTVVVDGGTFCDGMTAVVEVHDPAAIEITATQITGLGCGEEYTGIIALQAGGGTGPLDFQWTGGQISPTISGLAAGFYHVMINDVNGCQIQQTFEVEGAVNVEADFEVSALVVAMVDGQAEVEVSNLSTGADTFLWNMGDGTFYEEANPIHTYTAPGVYDIDLEASSADCFGMTSISIEVVEEVVSVEEIAAFGATNVWMNDQGIQIDFDLAQAENLSIQVYNSLGQLITQQDASMHHHDRVQLEVPANVRWSLVILQDLNTGRAHGFKAIR